MCPAEINPGGMPRSQTRPSLPSSRPLERRKRAKGDFHRQSDHSYSKLKCSDNPNALEVNELDFAASAGRFKSWVPRLRRRREPRHTALIAAYSLIGLEKTEETAGNPGFSQIRAVVPRKQILDWASSLQGPLFGGHRFSRFCAPGCSLLRNSQNASQISPPDLQVNGKQPRRGPRIAADCPD